MALAALVSLAPACRGATLPPGSTDPITIGVVLTLDDDGDTYREAIELAVREANAAGGALPGRRVEVVVADSMYDPMLAASEAQRLIDAGAVAILGDGSSDTTLAIARDIATTVRVPLVSCSATSVLLTAVNADESAMRDRFFARTAPTDERQAAVLADVIRDEGACTRLAIMLQTGDYATPIADAVTAELRMGTTTSVVARVGYAYGSDSYAAQVTEAVAASPDCVALIGYPVEAATILRDWEMAGAPDVTWIGADGLRTDDFRMEAVLPARIDGFLGTAPVTDLAAPAYQTFRDRWRAAYARTDAEPGPYTANCYDAAALVLLAIADAGSTEGDAIRDALYRVAGPGTGTVVRPDELANGFRLLRMGTSINYSGASGSVDLDMYGDVPTASYEVWRFDAAVFATTMMGFVRVREVAPGDPL